MKIFVSIKQVPDTSGKVAVNPDGTLNRASMQTITNPDDMNALEAALKIKDEIGCKVIAVTMGPAPAAGMLREALAMGADEAILVSAREFGGSDTYATSQVLAAAIDTVGVEDDDQFRHFLKFQQHLHLTVGGKAGQYPCGMEIVEEFAAKLQI